TAWSQRGGDIDGEGADDQSGESVSLSSDGSVLAIGAADNDGNGDSSGHVRVYEWTGTVWSQRGGDIDGESAGDLSGCSVSLSSDGSVLAIGAVANDDYSGHVRVYEWDGTDWSQQGADIDGEAFGGGFGISVSLSSDGSVLAIGAPGDNGNGSNSGSVRVYEWDGTGWFQRGGDIDGASAGDGSGSAVSLSSDGSVLAIGAPNNDDNGDYSGHVRVYEWDETGWSQRGGDIDGASAGDMSGSAVSLSSDGSVLAIGAPNNDDNGDDSGHVRVYEACISTCEISAIAVSNLSSCTPGTDTYTADVTVSFQSVPATGTLELSGSGSASVSVGDLDSPTSHVFTGVEMPADGEAIDLSVTFTDATSCVFTESNAGTAPVSCQNCLSENTLQITTIQSAPPLVLDENGEWFTVYNPTDSVVDLNGYTILDDGTDSHSITTSLLLPAGGSITLGNNADTLTNGGVHIDYAYGSDITLDDEEDEIVLVCSGTEVARAAYSGGLFAGCTNPTVALGADGTVSITPAQVEDGTMALDGLAGLWLDVTDFDCSNQGQDNPVELTVVDTDGDTSTCMANVSVIDNMAPTAVCADVTIALDSAGTALLVADSLDGGSTDNCATSFTYEASQVAFSCDDLGEQSVTLTVSDGSPDAESGNCTATVTVVDDAAPVAECQDAAVQLDAAGMATLSPEAVNNGSYDNCTPAPGLVLEVSQDQFDCGDLGQQTVSLFVSDGSPNSGSGSCMAMVTVEDLLPPQAECTDVTVQLDENGTAFLPSFNVDGGSSDNCGTLDLALSQSSFDCTHLGENAVDMIVSDGSNNQDTCTATITVEDVISPVAVCQPFSVSLDSTGFASITADNVDGGSTDNCPGVSLMLNQSTFDCGDIGTNTVTLTVTDA
ncbi:lamin tail domain-containing protein, partial [Phaeodactylibacter xiamenensis]